MPITVVFQPVTVRESRLWLTVNFWHLQSNFVAIDCLGFISSPPQHFIIATGWPKNSKPLPNYQEIVLNRIKACQ